MDIPIIKAEIASVQDIVDMGMVNDQEVDEADLSHALQSYYGESFGDINQELPATSTSLGYNPENFLSYDAESFWMFGNYGTARGQADTYHHNSIACDIYNKRRLAINNPKRHIYPKKNHFKDASPIKEGIGLELLKKLGWREGTGIGKNEDGRLEPLLLDFKRNRKGVLTRGESTKKKKDGSTGPLVREKIQTIQGKNTVDIVANLCRIKKWPLPIFTCSEVVPRKFLWKASLNGVEYEPTVASNNKKAGKSQVCYTILETLGVIDKYNWKVC